MVVVGVVGLRCERGGEEEEEEEGVSSLSIFSYCLVYLPVSFRRAIFPCVVISLPLFSLSLLLDPRCPVAAHYFSPSLSSKACLVSVRVTPGWGRGRNGRRRDRGMDVLQGRLQCASTQGSLSGKGKSTMIAAFFVP